MQEEHAVSQRGERTLNDNRASAQPGGPVMAAQRSAPREPTRGERWQSSRPSKMMAFWLCLGAVLLTLAIGFTWGGWTTAASAKQMATTGAQTAVTQRLATICVAQFGLDANQAQNRTDLQALNSSQRSSYVTDGGWATMPGETAPDSKVVSACVKQLMATAVK